jgi:PAS domain S-box-containing protein
MAGTPPARDARTHGSILASARGELAELVRRHDWGATPLGPVAGWPASLCVALGICLHSRTPMVVWWGEELVNLYNDAAIPLLGAAHPAALGRPAAAVWGDVWHASQRHAAAVLRGDAAGPERIRRAAENGGEAVFTWFYGGIPDETGGVGGVLCTITDDTVRLAAEEALQASEARYRTLLDAVDEGFCVLQMIFDDDGRAVDYLFIEANPAYGEHTGLHDAVGHTARELLPELEEHWFEIYGRVARTRTPLRFESGSAVMGRAFDVFAFPVDAPEAGRVALLFKDVTAQKRAEHELSSSRERLRAVLENALDVAYRRDLRSDTYDYLSPAVRQVLGIDPDAMRTMPLADLIERIHPDDRAAIREAMDTGNRRGRGTVEYRFRGDDGEYRWFADHFTVQTDDDGEPLFRTGTVRDITDRRRDEDTLRAASRAAEAAAEAKSRFLAVMSHELRTPLTGVIGYADLLGTEVLGPMTAKQQESLARIKASSWHLVGIIDEILTLSRVEADREEVHAEETDVAAIVRDVVHALAAQAEGGDTALRWLGADAAVLLHTDPRKVRQILVNLVGNAVKFTPGGSVTVALERPGGAGADGELRVQVRDTGPGIAPADQERIFEAFTQVDGSLSRGGSGTGLGLAISRRLARMLGGDVTVASAPGEGSTFTLTLPAAGT